MKKISTLSAASVLAGLAIAGSSYAAGSGPFPVTLTEIDNFDYCRTVFKSLDGGTVRYDGVEGAWTDDTTEKTFANNGVNASILNALYSAPACVAEITAKESENISIHAIPTSEDGVFQLHVSTFKNAQTTNYELETISVNTERSASDDRASAAAAFRQAVNGERFNLAGSVLDEAFYKTWQYYVPNNLSELQTIASSNNATLFATKTGMASGSFDAFNSARYYMPFAIDNVYYGEVAVTVEYDVTTVADAANLLKVSFASEEGIPSDVEIGYRHVKDDVPQTALREGDKLIDAYSMALYSPSTGEYYSTFKYGLHVFAPIAADSNSMSSDSYYARFVNGEGKVTENDIHAIIAGDDDAKIAQFVVNHLSTYAIVQTDNPVVGGIADDEPAANNPKAPDTGVAPASYVIGSVVAVLAAVAATVAGVKIHGRKAERVDVDAKLQ